MQFALSLHFGNNSMILFAADSMPRVHDAEAARARMLDPYSHMARDRDSHRDSSYSNFVTPGTCVFVHVGMSVGCGQLNASKFEGKHRQKYKPFHFQYASVLLAPPFL